VFDQRLHLLLVCGRHLQVLRAGGGEDGLSRERREKGEERTDEGTRKEGREDRKEGRREE
jgi:hypothetical protein